MRTNLMRCFAVALGVSISSVAQAQYPQSAPQGSAFGSGFLTVTGTGATQNPYANQQVKSRWGNFNVPASVATQPSSTVYRQVSQTSDDSLLGSGSAAGKIEEIAPGVPQINPHAKPGPAARQQVVPKSGSYQPGYGAPVAPSYVPQPDPYTGAPATSSIPNQGCGTSVYNGFGANPYAGNYSSPYSSAVNSPWDGGNCGSTVPMSAFGQQLAAERPTLFPWFGGFNLLYLDIANNSNKALAINGTPALYSSAVDSDASLGYELSAGRYLKCGTYGLGFTYFNFNPDAEQVIISGAPGSIRSAMQGHHDYHLDLGGGPQQVYAHIFGTGFGPGASNVRASRDVDIQGLELNLFSFGMMGYGRSTPNCGYSSGSHWNPFAGLLSNYGFGRAGGPLTRPAANRVQITTSHGLRWFQISDDAELAYNIDGTAGYQAQDIYDRVNIDNNLYGYQFGGLLNYCISDRMNYNVGGKIGVYANDVEANRRVGTETQTAYRFGAPNDLAQTRYNDVVLATLGQVNVGLGYRISNAWTINGGYQVMGVSGIATSFDQMAQDFGTSANPGSVHANDSLLLHGAYFGTNFNW